MLKHIFIIIFSTLIVAGCAQQQAKQKQPTPQGAIGDPALGGVSGGSTETYCVPSMTAATTTWTGKVINGNDSQYNLSSTPQQPAANLTLCQALNQSPGAKVALFQFVGVICASCRTEATRIQQVISPKGGAVAHYLVFTDNPADVIPTMVQDFVQTHAQGRAIAVYDPAPQNTLWSKVNGGNKVLGGTLAMNNRGHMVSAPTNTGLESVLSQIDILLQNAQ